MCPLAVGHTESINAYGEQVRRKEDNFVVPHAQFNEVGIHRLYRWWNVKYGIVLGFTDEDVIELLIVWDVKMNEV